MSKQTDKARKFIKEVKSQPTAPIYFIYGEETFMLDEAMKAIKESACPDGLNDFNYDAFQGKDIKGDIVRSCAEMLPMMSKRRLVIVQDIQEVPASELEPLKDYFKDPSPTTCLVLHARTAQKKLDGRLGIFRALKKAAKWCEFKPMYENEVGPFLQGGARRRGLNLDREVPAYLVDAVGTKLAALDQALEKIDLFLGNSGESDDSGPRRVSIDDAKSIIARTRSRSVFDLTDALGESDFQGALEVLAKMLLEGEAPILISHMITRHFRIVARLQDPSLRRANRSEKASAAKVSPFFVKEYERHGRAFSPAEVGAILRRMLDVDIALKSSPVADQVILEELLTDICFRSLRTA